MLSVCFNAPMDERGQQEAPEESSDPQEVLLEKASLAARRAEEESEALHTEMDARLADLERKAKSAKQSYRNAGTKAENRTGMNAVEPGSQRGLGVGMAVAMSIIGLPIGGFFIGMFIEMQGGSTEWKTWLGLGGAVVGIIHGAWMAQKLQK